MFNTNQVLREHYTRMAQKFAAWASLVAILMTAMVPLSANAAQLSARKVVLSDSAGNASSVGYDHFFTNATTSAALGIKAIRFQYCTSPLYNTSCTLPTGLVRGTTIATQTNNGGAMTNAFSAATSGTTDVLLTNATGNTFTAAQIVNIRLTGFTNPTAPNTQFYVRVETCTTIACTIPGDVSDYGSMAVSTSQMLSVTATVQEDLTFCVGTAITSNCGTISGSTVTLAPNPMGATAPSTGTAKMAASTNATGGYTITYNATTFTNTTSDTIASAATGGVTLNAGGTEQFGFNLVANSGGNFGTYGTNYSGGTGISIVSAYGTNNQIAYNTAGATSVATASGPTAQTTYTMSFGANVSNTTKPGVYTATQTFIATGTF
jgi:hypothetical protein